MKKLVVTIIILSTLMFCIFLLLIYSGFIFWLFTNFKHNKTLQSHSQSIIQNGIIVPIDNPISVGTSVVMLRSFGNKYLVATKQGLLWLIPPSPEKIIVSILKDKADQNTLKILNDLDSNNYVNKIDIGDGKFLYRGTGIAFNSLVKFGSVFSIYFEDNNVLTIGYSL